MTDSYTCYEVGLQAMKQHISPASPHHRTLLVYEQRLRENIDQSRRHGDTDTRKSDRSQIVEGLNHLASAVLGTSFNDLCRLKDEPEQPAPPSDDTSQTQVQSGRDTYVNKAGGNMTQTITHGLSGNDLKTVLDFIREQNKGRPLS